MAGYSERNSSVELLRIILGFAVVILYFNYLPGGTGAVELTTGDTHCFLNFLEIICMCAVNTFVLISGYYGSKNYKINFSKIIKLFLQTIVFQFLISLVICVTSGNISIAILCKSLIPANYYVVLYSSLMLISPFINKLLVSFKEQYLKAFVLITFLLFSVYPTFVDILEEVTGLTFGGLSSVGISGSNGGYTITNFILMYIIGCYLRISNKKTKNLRKLLTTYILIVTVLFVWQELLPRTAHNYCNPFVIIESVCLLLLFLKVNLKSRIINLLAPSSFTCFLINISLVKFFGFDWIYEKSFFTFIIGLFIEAVVIYMFAFILTLLWSATTKKIFYYTIDKIPAYCLED